MAYTMKLHLLLFSTIFILRVLILRCNGEKLANVHIFDAQENDALVFAHNIEKRSIGFGNDETCQTQEQNFLRGTMETPDFRHYFAFDNETKFSMSLAWAGDDTGRILVVVTEDEDYFGTTLNTPTVYLSEDSGKQFKKVTDRVGNAAIRKSNGLQKSPVDSNRIFIVAAGDDESTTNLYVTSNSGSSFTHVPLDFKLTGSFVFHPKNALYMLTVAGINSIYVSFDGGYTWNKKKDAVKTVKWTDHEKDDPATIYVSYYPNVLDETELYSNMINNNPTKLAKSVDKGNTWIDLLSDVYEFGVEGKFLFASIMVGIDGTDRIVKVSTDAGLTWNHALLPTLDSDRFFSVLDMSEDLVFMHVDSAGDTGFGTLYTSNTNGIIYSASLEEHLYPNYIDVTDFYKVESMRGVYLASQLKEDNSVHTMITFDRGGKWEPVRRPEGALCQNELEDCYLQIHSSFSKSMGVQSQLPLSVENAKGIILVHGHVASALQTTPPDVFVTSDGGYTWFKALDGPHHYQIADHGGLLVAVPASDNKPKDVKFSTDEGRCWHIYRFTDEDIYFTGLLTEPGSRSMSVSIWGFGAVDRVWRVHTIDFTKVIKDQCDPHQDYETWLAHGDNSNDPELAGCLLGMKETFMRLKKDSWCANGHDYERVSDETVCKCVRDDYQCDFGYHRPDNTDDCVEDPEFRGGYLDICLRGHVEEIVTVGYRKIPGDQCKNGFSPSGEKLEDLHKTCEDSNQRLLEQQYKDGYVKEFYHTITNHHKPHKALIIAVVLCTIIVAFIVIIYFVDKYKLLNRPNVSYRYSMLNREPDDLEAIATAANIYDDDSDEESSRYAQNIAKHQAEVRVPSKKPESVKPGKPKVKSYHDDSDDDMLI